MFGANTRNYRVHSTTPDKLMCGLSDEQTAPKSPLQEAASRPLGNGRVALHIQCRNSSATLETVKGLVDAYPAATRKRDAYGRTPLFYAIRSGCSLDIVSFLFQTFPGAIRQQDECCTTCLSLLYARSKSPRYLKAILELEPWLALARGRSFSAPTLTSKMCTKWLKTAKTPKDVQNSDDLLDQWEKLLLTIRAAYRAKVQPRQNVSDLQAALEIPCPSKIICWIIDMYPEQAEMPLAVSTELMPLHLALFKAKGIDNAGRVINALVKVCPRAAQAVVGQKLALHVALDSNVGWEDGLESILYAAPEVLHEPGLLPYCYAANQKADLTTIFNLLKEGPLVDSF